ncbi:hypothetical protein GCM10023235_05330 [Kitasatospora terrestris]|uniref:Uncharacterized protein n=1 Tax=Kitasatospora terrestris TaxID=258051 RepID=A0ABP9D7S5_9ACTN
MLGLVVRQMTGSAMESVQVGSEGDGVGAVHRSRGEPAQENLVSRSREEPTQQNPASPHLPADLGPMAPGAVQEVFLPVGNDFEGDIFLHFDCRDRTGGTWTASVDREAAAPAVGRSVDGVAGQVPCRPGGRIARAPAAETARTGRCRAGGTSRTTWPGNTWAAARIPSFSRLRHVSATVGGGVSGWGGWGGWFAGAPRA